MDHTSFDSGMKGAQRFIKNKWNLKGEISKCHGLRNGHLKTKQLFS